MILSGFHANEKLSTTILMLDSLSPEIQKFPQCILKLIYGCPNPYYHYTVSQTRTYTLFYDKIQRKNRSKAPKEICMRRSTNSFLVKAIEAVPNSFLHSAYVFICKFEKLLFLRYDILKGFAHFTSDLEHESRLYFKLGWKSHLCEHTFQCDDDDSVCTQHNGEQTSQ